MYRYLAARIAAIFMCLCLVAPAHADYPLAYVGDADIRDVAMSPDGTQVAYLRTQYFEGIRSERDWDAIEFVSTETTDVTLEFNPEFRLYYWVSWPVDDLLITQALTYDIGRRSAKTQIELIAIDPTDGSERILYKGDRGDYKKSRKVPRIMGISTTTREIALSIERSGRKDLVAIHLDTGAQRTLANGSKKTLYWEMDSDLVPYLRIDEGRRRNEKRVYVLDERGRWVLRRTYNAFENNFSAASDVTEDEQLLVVHRPEGAEQAALYAYDIGDDVYTDLIFEKPGHDLVLTKRTKFGGQLMYVGWYEDTLEKKWFDDEFETAGSNLDKALKPEDNWTVVETSEDNNHWLIYVSSPTRPGSLLYYNLETKRARFIGKTRPELKSDDVHALRRIDYTASDGMELYGYFIASKRGPEGPLVVMPHGGPVARDYADFDGIAQYLANKGYNVFQPQFRGGGELGVTFEMAGYGQWGRAMQTDIEDGVDTLIAEGLLSPDSRRVIFGLSYGGYAALAAATLTPENYACAISVNGVSDLPMFLQSYDQSDADEQDIYRVWVDRIGDPETDMDRILEVSPRHQMDKVRAPILLIHGSADDIVDVQQSRAAYETLVGLQKYVVYHELEGADHQIWDEDQRTEMLVYVDRFLFQCVYSW